MKLDPELKAKLLAKNPPLESAVDDACELLTMKVVLLLTSRRKSYDQAIKDMQDSGQPAGDALLARRREIGELTALIAEMP